MVAERFWRCFWRALALGMAVTLFASPQVSAESDPPAGPEQEFFPAAFAYALAHPEASPPGANDFGCRPNHRHPNPVVLSHGTFENAYENWAKLSRQLAGEGYCVFAPNVGGVSGSPFKAVGDIADSAAQFSAYVDRVLQATGASKVDIVGHSQGGMMPRYYINKLGGAAKVGKLVAVTPSNHGTTAFGLVDAIGKLPGGEQVYRLACPSCAQQSAGSPFLTDLNSGAETHPAVFYTVIGTKLDEVVTPFTSSFLDAGGNVSNLTLQDFCLLAPAGHILASYDPVVLRLVRTALDDPQQPQRPGCTG